VELPRGASPQVVEAARRIAARGGRDALGQVAKLHFATTQQVLDG
jgi:ribonuclease HIII